MQDQKKPTPLEKERREKAEEERRRRCEEIWGKKITPP